MTGLLDGDFDDRFGRAEQKPSDDETPKAGDLRD